MAKFTRTTNTDKAYDTVGRSKRYDGMYIGYVKNNTDIQKMGRLQIWIPEFGSQEEDKTGWMTVSYSSPFAGATSPKLLGNNEQLDSQTQTSYGFWAVPPDLDNQVTVMFANGDPTRGVVMGCLFQQSMNQMVPGIPAGKTFQFPTTDAPTAEYNKQAPGAKRDDSARPAAITIAEGINAQGLIHDDVRGVSTSGARRESPSEVYGMLTPGPKHPDAKGKRLGGSAFVMDDGEGSEHVRIRTKSGAQFLVDETNGIVYAINKLGTSWMQMDAAGNFDIYAAQSMSVRSVKDINFRADNDINIEAGRNVLIKAAADKLPIPDTGIPIETAAVGAPLVGEGGDIIIEAANDLTTTSVRGSMTTTVLVGDINTTVTGNRATNIVGDDSLLIGGGQTMTTTGSLDLGAAGGITMSTAGTFGVGSPNFNVASSGIGTTGKIAAGGNITAIGDMKTSTTSLNKLNGHDHVISSGSSAGKTLPFIGTGGGGTVVGPIAGVAAPAIPGIPTIPLPKTNVLLTFIPPVNDTRLTQPVLTMVGRFLTYEPCPEHENTGGQGGLLGGVPGV